MEGEINKCWGECIEKERRVVAIKCAWGGQRGMERPAERRELRGIWTAGQRGILKPPPPSALYHRYIMLQDFLLRMDVRSFGGANHWTTQCHLLLSTYCHVDGLSQ